MITNQLKEKMSLAINVFKGLECPSDPQLDKFINVSIKNNLAAHVKKLPDGFTYSRKLYRAFKVDPTKHRPSSEAILRRLKKGLEFPRIHPLVDLTNCLSFVFQIPYGLYDLTKIKGRIISSIGGEQHYSGLGKGSVSLAGKIVLADDEGPFGNPSSDSLRTSVDGKSRDILQVIFFHPEYPLKEQVLKETGEAVKRFFKFEKSDSDIFE